MISVTSVKELLNHLNALTSQSATRKQGKASEYARLVLMWPDGQAPISESSEDLALWIAQDRDCQTIAQGESSLENLPQADHVVALLGSQHMTPMLLDLPKLSARRQSEALQWAAEEYVAGPIEQEHVVAGLRNSEGQLQAVAVQHEWMRQAHPALFRAGVDVAMPDAACLPYESGQVSLARIKDRLLMRWAPWSFGSFDLDTGLLLLEAHSESQWLWWGETAPPEVLAGRVERRAIDQSVLKMLSRQVISEPINLLVDPYPPASSQARLGQWRWVAGLFAAVLVLMTMSVSVEQWMLSRQANSLRLEVAQTFQRIFPNQPAVGRERELVMREMARLQFGRSAGLLELLSQVIPTVAGQSEISVEGLDYRAGELTLMLEAPDVASLDALASRLRSLQLEASVESATLTGEGASAQILVQRLASRGGSS